MLRPRSLKSLLLLHETAFLVLVAVTGALGGMWAYFWQQSSQQSVQINALLYQALQVRGDLYRELKEITRARLVEDPTALNRYWNHLYQIDQRFYRLQSYPMNDTEKRALDSMRHAYEMMQSTMNKIFVAEPTRLSETVRNSIDPAYEEWILGDFERAFNEFSELVAARRRSLEQNLAYWTGLAPIIISVPILLAVALLWYSHRILQHGFVQPIGEITRGAKQMSQGELDYKIPEHGVEEVIQLAKSINNMAADLASSRNALIESERQAALGSLVPVVAHNIRNPLASIRAASQIIDQLDEAGNLQKTKQALIDTVDRLERWVSSLLSYLNPLKPHKRTASLSTVVDGALSPLNSKLTEKHLHIARQNWYDGENLYVDVDLLEQAVYGLLNNAFEASPQAGTITLALETTNASNTLIIDDEGPGLPFNPHPTNLSPGPSTKRFGTGLGIPFAFKICHAHGGNLKFETAPGGGTRVRLSLPTSQSH